MVLRFYNTMTRRLEEFQPLDPPRVLMYNCGPTVYDYFHIGNARNFVVMDVLRRYLGFRGYEIKFVQNLTDIDDKIIDRARREGVSWDEVARKYTQVYFDQVGRLGVEPADVHPKATDHIAQMIALIGRLMARGLAYKTRAGDVYFRVRRFPSYGALSGKKIEDLIEGARVEPGQAKEDPLDFALWKASKPDEPKWESPWGPGRPGWHIECTAMIHTHLGESIDIHAGGVDLVFPHHENERAQSEGATGKPYVRYWIHNGFLNIEGEKMSKSLGNIKTIEQVLERFSPLTVRYFLLMAHYRSPLDFSAENLASAKAAVRRLRECLAKTQQVLDHSGHPAAADDAYPDWFEDAAAVKFVEAMDNDLNTARALAAIFDLVRDLNSLRTRENLGGEELSQLSRRLLVLRRLCKILGLDPALDREARSTEVPPGLAALAHELLGEQAAASTGDLETLLGALIDIRAEARARHDYATADTIRNRLHDAGFTLEDTPQGTIWKKVTE